MNKKQKNYLTNMEKKDKLEEIRNELNSLIDKKIEQEKTNALYESVKSLPLFSLTNIFESVSDSLMDSKKGERVIRDYVKTIKENKSLRQAYSIASSIKKPIGIQNTEIFTNVALNSLNECHNSEYRKGVNSLSEVVTRAIRLSNPNSSDFEGLLKEADSEISNNLQYFLNNKPNRTNLTEWSNRMAQVNEFVAGSNILSGNDDNEEISDKEAVCKLKEIAESSEPWMRKSLEKLTEVYLGTKGSKELFEECKEECLTMIEKNMEESNVEEKSRLCEIKDKLDGKQFNENTLQEDVFKMMELTEIINNN